MCAHWDVLPLWVSTSLVLVGSSQSATLLKLSSSSINLDPSLAHPTTRPPFSILSKIFYQFKLTTSMINCGVVLLMKHCVHNMFHPWYLSCFSSLYEVKKTDVLFSSQQYIKAIQLSISYDSQQLHHSLFRNCILWLPSIFLWRSFLSFVKAVTCWL